MKKLIFTDLDGTLLDLESYSAAFAKTAVQQLKAAGVSIIFCSSKTWAEQAYYLRELALDEPVIVENGSGIFLPENHQLPFDCEIKHVSGRSALVLGKTYQGVLKEITDSLSTLNANFKFYFNQSIEEIAKTTGLSQEAAAKAKDRSFSETLFNAQSDPEGYEILASDLQENGLNCTPGSRYITITGNKSDKGSAVQMVIEAYRKNYSDVASFGIGDSQNDLEMLRAVDHPYLVQKPDRSWATLDVPNLAKIAAIGPEGWVLMAAEVMAP